MAGGASCRLTKWRRCWCKPYYGCVPSVGTHGDECIEPRTPLVVCVDAREVGVDELTGRDSAVTHCGAYVRNGRFVHSKRQRATLWHETMRAADEQTDCEIIAAHASHYLDAKTVR